MFVDCRFIILIYISILLFLGEEDGSLKWKAMLVEVKNPNCIPGTNQPEMVPAGFVVCSGEKTPEKLHLTNRMVCDWQVRFQKLRFKKDECPFYQPVAQNMIRAFFGTMRRNHNWQWTDGDFKNFAGSLYGVIEALYDSRRQEFVSFVVICVLFDF